MPVRLKTSSREQKFASPKALRGAGKLKVVERLARVAVKVMRNKSTWEVRRCTLNEVTGKYHEVLVRAFPFGPTTDRNVSNAEAEVEAERLARHILEGSK